MLVTRLPPGSADQQAAELATHPDDPPPDWRRRCDQAGTLAEVEAQLALIGDNEHLITYDDTCMTIGLPTNAAVLWTTAAAQRTDVDWLSARY